MRRIAYLCILAATSGLWLSCQTEPADIFERYFIMEPALSADVQTGDGLFKQGMAEYRRGRYQLATGFFQRAHTLMVGTDTLTYYIGMSETGLGHYAKAMSFFDVSEETGDTQISMKAGWQSALLSLKLGKPEIARAKLQAIAADAEHPFTPQAEKVLRQLPSN